MNELIFDWIIGVLFLGFGLALAMSLQYLQEVLTAQLGYAVGLVVLVFLIGGFVPICVGMLIRRGGGGGGGEEIE